MDNEKLLYIQEKIEYTFKNKRLLQQAFTRRSYSQEHPDSENNEILEFIGDKALDLAIVRALSGYYGSYTDDGEYSCRLMEGKLTEIKKQLVEGKMLARRIGAFGFQDYLIMGKGDCYNNVQEGDHVKEDLFEAIIGAVALDCDWNAEALDIVVEKMLGYRNYLEEGFSDKNYITKVQQWCKKEHLNAPRYEFVDFNCFELVDDSVVSGDRRFVCRLTIESIEQPFYGRGNSKRDARMSAASEADVYLQKKNMLHTVWDEIGKPVPESAIGQLQELAQKKYIPMPQYQFEETHDASGNPIWTCICRIDGMNCEFTNISSSKKECKRTVAHEMLLFVLNNMEKHWEGEL